MLRSAGAVRRATSIPHAASVTAARTLPCSIGAGAADNDPDQTAGAGYCESLRERIASSGRVSGDGAFTVVRITRHWRCTLVDAICAHSLQSRMAFAAQRVAARARGKKLKFGVIKSGWRHGPGSLAERLENSAKVSASD